MKVRAFIALIILSFSTSCFAEFYVVYGCGTDGIGVHRYKHKYKHKKRHYVKHYHRHYVDWWALKHRYCYDPDMATGDDDPCIDPNMNIDK